MKKNYTTPKLSVHGSLEELTQSNVKKFGANDGWVLAINGDPSNTAPIGPLGS